MKEIFLFFYFTLWNIVLVIFIKIVCTHIIIVDIFCFFNFALLMMYISQNIYNIRLSYIFCTQKTCPTLETYNWNKRNKYRNLCVVLFPERVWCVLKKMFFKYNYQKSLFHKENINSIKIQFNLSHYVPKAFY